MIESGRKLLNSAQATPEAQASGDSPAEPRPAAPDSEAWLDRVLDQRYRILRLLGEGGMGAVFVAEHLTLHKLVALKIVRLGLKADSAEVAVRLAREAMATARLEHPHVAGAIDYGALPEGGAYFVMQLVRGTSLRRMLSGGRRLPWARACEIAAQVADAISATRAVGIVHRDLKPDNILVEVREDGSDLVKVLDFGIAQVASRSTSATPGAELNRQITVTGTVMGTPGYMAPEQAVGEKVDHRSDLYALGVVLWECIAGRELWVGTDLTTLVSRQMSERAPLLSQMEIDASLPPQLDELIAQLTERLPSNRPQHAAQVRDALRRMTQAYAVMTHPSQVPANTGQSRRAEPPADRRFVAFELNAGEEPAEAERGPAPRLRRRHRARHRPRSRPTPRSSFWIAGMAALILYIGVREFIPQLHSQPPVAAQPAQERVAVAPAPESTSMPSLELQAPLQSIDRTPIDESVLPLAPPADPPKPPRRPHVARRVASKVTPVLPDSSAPAAAPRIEPASAAQGVGRDPSSAAETVKPLPATATDARSAQLTATATAEKSAQLTATATAEKSAQLTATATAEKSAQLPARQPER